MDIYINGFTEGLKIHAIKELRALTGYSLKDSKLFIDRVDRGERVIVAVPDSFTGQGIEVLRWERADAEPPSLTEMIDTLRYFPLSMTIGQVIGVLEGARARQEAGR